MLGSSEDAEDVLQEAFCSAFKNIQQFSGKVTFGAWLKRIVINKCLDFLRKKKIRLVDIDRVSAQVTETQSDDVFYEVPINYIHEEIKKLPKGCRLVFTLYMMEGYDHSEIAQIMNFSESTSKSQYRRAKILLKERLQGLTVSE